jgi:hypothetical protein
MRQFGVFLLHLAMKQLDLDMEPGDKRLYKKDLEAGTPERSGAFSACKIHISRIFS